MILDPANDDVTLDDRGKVTYRVYMGTIPDPMRPTVADLAALKRTELFVTFEEEK